MFEQQQKPFPLCSFFPIPNPNPLLSYSFDIPQPIIHPPGTDPCCLSNPNLHVNDRLEPLPALDIDPGAASRGVIITQTTDLTASEHAGQSLGETTTTYTTSCSPGNFDIVTQLVVNDGKVRISQIENTRSSPCDNCNITCNTEDTLEPEKSHLLHNGAWGNPFRKHLEGEKHDAQGTSRLLCGDGFPNPTSVRTPPAQRSVWCEVCKISCGSGMIFSRHILGKKHLKNSKKMLAPPSTSVSSMAAMISGPEENPQLPKGKIVNSKEGEVAWVEPCKVNGGSNAVSRHLSGNHQILEKIPGLPSTPVDSVTMAPVAEIVGNPKSIKGEIVISKDGKFARCELCEVSCISSALSTHLLGKKHMKNLAKSKKIPDLPSTSIASIATPPSTGPVENPKSIKGEIVNMEGGKNAWCELVIASCTSGLVSGNKHLNHLQESEKIPYLPPTPIALATALPTGPVENPKSTKGEFVNSKVDDGKSARCELCGVDCVNSRTLKEHVSGKKHQKKMKKSEQLFGHSPAPAAEPAVTKPLQDPVKEEGKVVVSKICKRKEKGTVTSHQDVDTKRQKVIEGAAASGCIITCTLCNVVCNSQEMFTSHLVGLQHTEMAWKQVKGGPNDQKV